MQIAKLNREPINCVTINWLLESKKKKKVLPYNSFEVPKIFYGVNVCLVGFSNEDSTRLKDVLTVNGAEVRTYASFGEFVDLEETTEESCDAIVTTEKQLSRLGPNVVNTKSPIVGVEWIELSLKRKICKWPRDYALNYEYLKKEFKSIQCEVYKLADRLSMFSQKDLFDRQYEFMTDVRILIDEGVNFKVGSLAKKLVCVCGGLYLNSLSPMVTHVLVSSLTENSYNKYLKFGNIIKVIRVEWFIDCVYMYRKLEEEDYAIRQFECKHTRENADIELNKTHSLSFNNNSLVKQASRMSISIGYDVSKPRVEKVTTNFKSTIFKNISFHIEVTHKKDKELHGIGTKIRENGGFLYDGISRNAKQTYIVLNDSPHN